MPKLHFSGLPRHADLPLHDGSVPPWLAQRMTSLGGAVIEAIVMEFGTSAVVSRLSDPFWFQALGCVLGMDWHSSGITTSVMGSLKAAINPRFNDLGIYICGGKGKQSKKTPQELLAFADRTGLNGDSLVHSSKLTAKVDNTAIQDGFQLYLHSFIVTRDGEWAVVQQGMNGESKMARRYHWHSKKVKSFIETPHTFIYGQNQGEILNLTDTGAAAAKSSMLEITHENPSLILPEIQRLIMPSHHDVRPADVNLKRLGAMLALTHEHPVEDFESLLMLQGVGPRTLQSLALVSEVIYGTSSRFRDPARFSFAHGGKDGHPFPVPLKVYDETIQILQTSVEKARIGESDKQRAIQSLSSIAQRMEQDFKEDERAFSKVVEQERASSWKYGGKTVFGDAKPPEKGDQLTLF